MTRKNACVAIAVALVAAGAILASNMGFKITYPLKKFGSSGSKSGWNTLALPDIRRAGLNDAFDLLQSIEGHGPPFTKVFSVSKFLKATDSLQLYTGSHSPGGNFLLNPGEGYRVQMREDVDYVIVGAQDPALTVILEAPGASSKTGTNDYAPPYNVAAASALELIEDIEGVSGPPFSKVFSIARFLTATDSLQLFTGRMGSPGANFDLVPGESYRVQMSVTVPYVASHY